MNHLSLLGLLLLCWVLTGCSVSTPKAGSHAQAPYDLVIEETRNDGQLLRVLGKIVAGDAPLILDDSYLQLKGLSGLTQKIARVSKVSEIFLPQDRANVQNLDGTVVLNPGSSVRCLIDVPSEGLTDYQLELFWTEEKPARVIVEKITPSGDGCGAATCLVTYTVDATVKLSSSGPRHEGTIAIASGILGKLGGVDLKGLIPENEEMIDVPADAADDSGSIPLRVKIIKELPRETAGNHTATLRVIE